MPNVLLTIDTELWPRGPLTPKSLSEAMRRDIYGITPRGDVGLRYQLDLLNAHGLKAVFFVEALFASFGGASYLRDIVAMIRAHGQDIQLHVHTEWLGKQPGTLLPGRTGQHLSAFTVEEQVTLLSEARDNLCQCDMPDPVAFRAGSFGANKSTLEACRRLGITIDSSYNVGYLGDPCELHTPEPLIQPAELHGLLEYPISFFHDVTGATRHAQLSACSSGELIGAMLDAAERGWETFVLLSHSFELLRWRPGKGHVAWPDRVMLRRFDRLCAFLAENTATFPTTTFTDLGADAPLLSPVPPVHASGVRTAYRMAEQLARRYWL